ncbi:MAG TPA: hypothetical protein PLF61_05835, partial [Candidatus Goldiibacteriota bacterium]|nr:hypothetical protein [Candidatus Goldiibacteriota bacterium]
MKKIVIKVKTKKTLGGCAEPDLTDVEFYNNTEFTNIDYDEKKEIAIVTAYIDEIKIENSDEAIWFLRL